MKPFPESTGRPLRPPAGGAGREEGSPMWEGLDYLREMNVASVLVRLVLAMIFGGFIGLERER